MGTGLKWMVAGLTGMAVGFTSAPVLGQARLTEHTLALDSLAPRPAGSLKDIAWLTGHWRGPALGGMSEEIWSPPLAGVMMGSYRLVKNDSTVFYEILTMSEKRGTLIVRLKHFNADLTGWEERDEVREFPLVRVDRDRLYFDGMTFERVTPDSIRSYVAIRSGEGKVQEAAFAYRRVVPALAPRTGARQGISGPQRD